MTNENKSHSINVKLEGDNPLNFDYWAFVELQNDSRVFPGGINMETDEPYTIKPVLRDGGNPSNFDDYTFPNIK